MRIISVFFVVSLLSVVSAQGGDAEKQAHKEEKTSKALTPRDRFIATLKRWELPLKEKMGKIPATLADAHTELERILSDEALSKIDAMPSEDGMTTAHFGLGLNIRNGWRLRADSVLAEHMKELGFLYADEMSGVILATLWCKRHGRDFRLEERAAEYKKYREEQESRTPKARAALWERLIGLDFEKRQVPMVPIVVRKRGVRGRFVSSFRDGVFLTAYHRGRLRAGPIIVQESYVDAKGDRCPMPEYDDFVHRGYCFDRTIRKARKMKPGRISTRRHITSTRWTARFTGLRCRSSTRYMRRSSRATGRGSAACPTANLW